MNQLSNNIIVPSPYNLEERTALFAEAVINLMEKLPQTTINRKLIEQLIASSGSIGANYCEATEGESKKDFIHKIGICKKEIKESRYWIRLLSHSNPTFMSELRLLWKESQELLYIFAKILRSSKRKI